MIPQQMRKIAQSCPSEDKVGQMFNRFPGQEGPECVEGFPIQRDIAMGQIH